jgi:hypothetical protein
MKFSFFGISAAEYRRQRRKERFEASDERPIPSSVLELLNRTKFLYRFWWFTHYFIGLSGVIAGALLTAISAPNVAGSKTAIKIFEINLSEYSWLVGIVAAVATSLVTFLGPLHKAERYWSAYHVLEQACLEYRVKDLDPKFNRLMRRVMQVRKILQVIDMDGLLAESASRSKADETKPDSAAA